MQSRREFFAHQSHCRQKHRDTPLQPQQSTYKHQFDYAGQVCALVKSYYATVTCSNFELTSWCVKNHRNYKFHFGAITYPVSIPSKSRAVKAGNGGKNRLSSQLADGKLKICALVTLLFVTEAGKGNAAIIEFLRTAKPKFMHRHRLAGVEFYYQNSTRPDGTEFATRCNRITRGFKVLTRPDTRLRPPRIQKLRRQRARECCMVPFAII